MLRQYFDYNEILKIFLTCFCNILFYVEGYFKQCNYPNSMYIFCVIAWSKRTPILKVISLSFFQLWYTQIEKKIFLEKNALKVSKAESGKDGEALFQLCVSSQGFQTLL